MSEVIEALLKRAERAEQRREQFRGLMQDIAAYAMPERDAWNSYGAGQERTTLRVFDSTAVVSAGRFANRLQGALFPPGERWAALVLPPDLSDRPGVEGVKVQLEAATARLFAHVHASSFDQVANEWALDLAAGVGAMLVENGRRATERASAPLLRFQAFPSALLAFDEGPFGGVEGVFLAQKMPARLVARTYPDAGGLPDALVRLARQEPEREVEILAATTYDAETADWAFRAIWRAERAVLAERRYRTCPWIVTRWSKAPGEVHGRGPLVAALPDIRTLNKLTELHLQAASFAVNPAWAAADDGVLNPAAIRITPGAVIPVRSNGGPMGPSLAPLTQAANSFQLSEMLADRLRTSIRQTLFDDPLPPEVVSGMTATEVAERIRMFQQDTGAFGRLQAEAVVPLIRRIVDIMDEAGEFEAYPDLMELLGEEVVRIRATSPLAMAQDRADAQAVLAFLRATAQLGEVGMTMAQSAIVPERAAPFVAERLGVPAALVPTEQENRARIQAQQEAQQAAEMMRSPVAAQAVGNLAPAMAGAEA